MIDNEKDLNENPVDSDQLSVFWEFLRVLPRIWVWLLILTILGGSLSVYRASKTYSPIYTASSTFIVKVKSEQSLSFSGTNYYNDAQAQHLASTFPYILTSGLLHRTVGKDLSEPVTSSISVEIVNSTNILILRVRDKNPDKAYRTLQSVIKSYPLVSEPIVGKVDLNILDDPGVPTKPDNPRSFIRESAFGAIVGFLLGLGWGVLVFITNRTVRNENDIRNKLGISCLGTIPRVHRKERTRETVEHQLITDPKAKDLLSEPFRMVKNQVEYLSSRDNHRIILITSATASEGKSFFSSNLVLSLITSGKKVTFIDCDLRHPTIRSIFDMEPDKGLYEYLKGDMELVDYLTLAQQENDHGFPNFLFLPGGEAAPDGSNLLSSERMKTLIDRVKEKSDYVILDSAPAGLLTDSVVLAQYADAAIMVIRKDVARIDLIDDAIAHLNQSDINVLGAVLNDA